MGLTVWSVRGGKTMVFSMVFMTSFHNSFSTRFSTVFSQILAKRVRLEVRGRSERRPSWPLTHRAPFPQQMWERTPWTHQRAQSLYRDPWMVSLMELWCMIHVKSEWQVGRPAGARLWKGTQHLGGRPGPSDEGSGEPWSVQERHSQTFLLERTEWGAN